MKAYLAGPITGCENHNFPVFMKYAYSLREKGYEVVNPAELEAKEIGPRQSWEYYLVRDLRELLGCDCIAVMPGWERSRGANLEIYVGWRLGFEIFDAETIQRVDVSEHNFSLIHNETNAQTFIKAFTPPLMERENPHTFEEEGKGSLLEFKLNRTNRNAIKAMDIEKNENILKEADRIVGGDGAYGHPKTDFERTAKIWSAVLGFEIPTEKVPLCMIGVKMSRQCNAAKRDNWVDMAGYAQTGYMVDQKDGRMV